jgi:menaquinone-dependent protoporphyrinogen oxidase
MRADRAGSREMKVLIAFRSRYGTTRSCAHQLARLIGQSASPVELSRRGRLEVASFDLVLIGGSIYGGRIQREVTSFCARERETLLRKKVGLFLCCLLGGEKARQQLDEAFPSWLRAHSFANELFGGELRPARLSVLDRLLVRGLTDSTTDTDLLDRAAVERLAQSTIALMAGEGHRD